MIFCSNLFWKQLNTHRASDEDSCRVAITSIVEKVKKA